MERKEREKGGGGEGRDEQTNRAESWVSECIDWTRGRRRADVGLCVSDVIVDSLLKEKVGWAGLDTCTTVLAINNGMKWRVDT